MSLDVAHSLGITALKKPRISIRFADSSTKTPQGYIEDLEVQIGDCLMPTDFQIVEMSKTTYMPLILGRPFLATAGALVDLPNKRVCLSNIDTSVFYEAIPENAGYHGSYVAIEESLKEMRYEDHLERALIIDKAEHLNDTAAGCVRLMDAEEQVMHVKVSIDTTHQHRSTPATTDSKGKENQVSIDFAAKNLTTLVSVDRHSPPVSIDTRRGTTQKVKQRNKPKSDRVFTSSHITLTPQRRVGDAIEYKVKCKGMSKPFSKVKALITPELKAQGQAALDDALSKVLKLNMHDHRVRGPRLNPPPPLPDPSSDSHHL